MPLLKPITLYGHTGGPNPWKVALVAEELKVPYEMKFLEFTEMKTPEYEKINPNGRVPSIHDPNTGIRLWESGAIIEYLVEKYDSEKKLSFEARSTEYFHTKQWLHFQVSGQGPYFGQAAWFKRYHPESVPSAVDRYVNEIRRVSGVINRVLEGRDWLVGDRYTYADVAFLPWFDGAALLTAGEINFGNEFPNLQAWLNRIKARPAVAKVWEERAKATGGK